MIIVKPTKSKLSGSTIEYGHNIIIVNGCRGCSSQCDAARLFADRILLY